MTTSTPIFDLRGALPTADEEDWRYSRIGDLRLDRYRAADAAAPDEMPAPVARIVEAAGDVDTVVWTVDGVLGGITGDAASTEPNVRAMTIATGDDALTELHDRLATPITVAAPKGRVLVVHAAVTGGVVSAPHLIVEVPAGGDAEVVEAFASPDGIDALVLPTAELFVANDARLRYGTVQFHGDATWQLATQAAEVQQGGSLRTGAAAFGGDYARFRADTRLVGRGAEADLSATSFGSGSQLLDFRTFQYHDAPDTTSNLLFVGALGETSGSVYTGLVKIAKDARGSNAFQTARNLKLSDDCWAESVPNLEIENNEVHCSHASTVSPVDPEHRFYLESRGVPTDRAERLLVKGFFDEITERLPIYGLDALVHEQVDVELERTLA